jgi:hypothetical protein
VENAETVRAPEAVELVDCGRASEQTKGFWTLIQVELGVPPNNWLFPL